MSTKIQGEQAKTPVVQRGTFTLRLTNPDGSVADEWTAENAATHDGLNYMQDVAFKGAAQQPAWFIGLMDNAGFSSAPVGDTMASHPGWAEFVGYSQGTRVAWTAGVPALGAISNPAAAVFSVTSNGTIRGMFLTSGSAKGGVVGKLWATALEASPRNVVAGQSLSVFYNNTLTPVS